MAVHWGGFLIALVIGSVKWFDVTEDIGYLAIIAW